MTARLTVVFDDEDLYRRTKVRAAQEGVTVKRIVEEALVAYIEGANRSRFKRTTAQATLDFMDKMAKLDDDPDGPTLDYSDIKHYLYGYPKSRLTPANFDEFAENLRPSGPRRSGTQ